MVISHPSPTSVTASVVLGPESSIPLSPTAPTTSTATIDFYGNGNSGISAARSAAETCDPAKEAATALISNPVTSMEAVRLLL